MASKPTDTEPAVRQLNKVGADISAQAAIEPSAPVEVANGSGSESESRELIHVKTERINKAWTISTVLIGILSLIGVGTQLWPDSLIDPSDYATRLDRVLSITPLIDGHNDLPWLLRVELQNIIYTDRLTFREGLLSDTDLQKIQKGRLGGQFWSVYCPCDEQHLGLNDESNIVRDALETIDVARRFIDLYDDIFEFCDTPSAARKAYAKGKVASMIGMEGLHMAGNTLASIRLYYDLGVRYITLTHNCDNAFATSAYNSSLVSRDNGLTEFGYKVVKEMNRLGMMIDLSHTSPQTMRDVLSVSEAPVIFSHTLATGVANHWRNTPDDVLRTIRKTGGIVMVTFINRFLVEGDPSTATLDDVIDHILYMADLAGWDHVGIGSDFDGTPVTPPDLEDVSKYPNIFYKLMEKGVSDENLRKLAGENILTVWQSIEDAAQKFKNDKPVEGNFKGRRFAKILRTPYMFADSKYTRNTGTDEQGNIVY